MVCPLAIASGLRTGRLTRRPTGRGPWLDDRAGNRQCVCLTARCRLAQMSPFENRTLRVIGSCGVSETVGKWPMAALAGTERLARVELRPATIKPLALELEGRWPASIRRSVLCSLAAFEPDPFANAVNAQCSKTLLGIRADRSRGRRPFRARTESNRCACDGAINGELFRSAVWPDRSD